MPDTPAIDTAPSVTRAIAALTPVLSGATPVAAFSHPSRPEASGLLVRFPATSIYAIASGRTLTTVPRAWAERQAASLAAPTNPTSEPIPAEDDAAAKRLVEEIDNRNCDSLFDLLDFSESELAFERGYEGDL